MTTVRGDIASGFAQLAEADVRHLIHPSTAPAAMDRLGPIMFVRGQGMMLEGPDGKQYYDAYSGMGNVILGHGHPHVLSRMDEQMRTLCYVPAYGRRTTPPAARLAELLTDVLPSGFGHVFFSNSGAEANESAMKVARAYHYVRGEPERWRIISQVHAYHGLTQAAMGTTWNESYHRYFTGPLDGFSFADFPDPYRNPIDGAAALEAEIQRLGPESVAAFIIEPIIGVGGHLIPPDDYYPAVREVCDRYGVLLIADEVVCGFGRTGTWWGMDHWDCSPDMITMAKGITTGYVPLGATAIHDRIWNDILEHAPDYVFNHGTTTSAHSLACAAAIGTIEALQQEDLVDQSRRHGDYMLDRIHAAVGNNPLVGNIRGRGMLASIELVADRDTKQRYPASEGLGDRINDALRSDGVIARTTDDIVALRPPLIATHEDIDAIIDRIASVLDGEARRLKG